MVSIGTITYLGSHGAELLRSGWTEAVLDPGVADWVRRIQTFGREADTADTRKLRVRLEDKGAIVAFHWRGAPDEEAARAAIDAIAQRAQEAGLHTHWGRKVLEVRPPITIDKGAGILRLLAEPGAAEIDTAMYVGDDTTDLDAFRTLGELVDRGPADARGARRRGLRGGPVGDHRRGRRRRRRDRRGPRAAGGADRLRVSAGAVR